MIFPDGDVTTRVSASFATSSAAAAAVRGHGDALREIRTELGSLTHGLVRAVTLLGIAATVGAPAADLLMGHGGIHVALTMAATAAASIALRWLGGWLARALLERAVVRAHLGRTQHLGG